MAKSLDMWLLRKEGSRDGAKWGFDSGYPFRALLLLVRVRCRVTLTHDKTLRLK